MATFCLRWQCRASRQDQAPDVIPFANGYAPTLHVCLLGLGVFHVFSLIPIGLTMFSLAGD